MSRSRTRGKAARYERAVRRQIAMHNERPREYAPPETVLRAGDSIERFTDKPTGDDPRRATCPAARPAPTVMANTDRWQLVNGAQESATARTIDEPAGTIFCSRPGNLRWTLANRRDSPKWVAEHGERRNRESDEPAPTITGEAHRWQLRNGTQDNACTRSADEPAGTLFFGQRLNNVSWVDGDESRRVSVAEAAILQSFPADYPWHGTKTSQFLQVGNAIPPGLGAAVLAVAAGLSIAHLSLAA